MSEATTVLFSGGRHSTLSACLAAESGADVHLLTTKSGAAQGTDLIEYRVRELQAQFPSIRTHVVRSTFGLFRRLAIAEIESDFATYRHNLIPIADCLASHAEGILYCRRENIPTLAAGFVSYDGRYLETTEGALPLLAQFVQRYGIEYTTPVLYAHHVEHVKAALLTFGISTNSLEATSLFDDSYTVAEPSTVLRYMRAKMAICEEWLRGRGVEVGD